MGKHSKKRQRTKTDNDPPPIRPLGSVAAQANGNEKDEEEKRLEAILFGTEFSSNAAQLDPWHLDDDTTGNIHAGEGLSHLLDSDLFYFDGGAPSALPDNLVASLSRDDSASDIGEAEAGPAPSDDLPRAGEEEEPQNGPPDEDSKVLSKATDITNLRKKKAAWVDPDDKNIKVSLASNNRLRKLRDAPEDDMVGGRDYEARLRRQYEKVHPVPDWASAARERLRSRKRRRSSQSDEAESDEEEGILPLLNTTGGLLASHRQESLPQGQLAIERLRDANQSGKADGEIRSLMFHPSPSVPILLTASADRRLRLFNIDGHTNPHLQSVHLPSLPYTTAAFHPAGTSVLLTGHRPYYYTYDLQSGACIRSPRGLWGTYAANQDNMDLTMETCAFSHTGHFLAVAGRRGHVHLVDWSKGSGQVVGSLKMNATVKDLWWTNDDKLMSLAEDTEVYLWDVGERRCVRRWKDHGGFGSQTMTGVKGDAYLAIGSKTGLVNVYGSDCVMAGVSDVPKPLKTISNLTTSISAMRFNHDGQILALASRTKKDQFKMVHLPSLTVFSNWPTSRTPLGHVTSMDFSPNSGYAAVGNDRGRVLLYNLRHYGSL